MRVPIQIHVDYQRLLVDHLNLVEQLVRTTGHRRHMSAAEQDDFGGFVRLRLIDDNYAVLRKFQNRSSLRTYLAAVVERLSLDYCVERWGRWRPSAVAERLGSVAVLLERLVTRDGNTLEEAIEIARTNHGAPASEGELRAIWSQLPVRIKTTEVSEDAAAAVSANDRSEATIEDAERQKDIERLERTLRSAFDAVSDQDRALIALRFDQDLPMVEIARLMGSSVPTMHRRLERAVRQLRLALSQSGVDPREVSGLIGHATIALSPMLRAEVERFRGPVRLPNRDG